MSLRVTILGCGSSGGVPRIGNEWGDCDPANPKNRRRRCSVLIEKMSGKEVTRVLVDTSPDMREQLLDVGIDRLDTVVYTHMHADHTNGIDDLRALVLRRKKRMPVWADALTASELSQRFSYVFRQPEGSDYPSILDLGVLTGPITVTGPGGDLTLTPIPVQHGRITALGFRAEGMAYIPDVSGIPESSWLLLEGLDLWIVDALRRAPHPSHSHLAQTLDWIERAKPDRAVLTNMHMDLDYKTLSAELPAGVSPAYDGLVLEL